MVSTENKLYISIYPMVYDHVPQLKRTIYSGYTGIPHFPFRVPTLMTTRKDGDRPMPAGVQLVDLM